IIAIPPASASRGRAKFVVCPSSRISPESGRRTPARIFIRVDLPAPFSPTRAWTWPSLADRLTASRTLLPAKDLVMPRISSAGLMLITSFSAVELIRNRMEHGLDGSDGLHGSEQKGRPPCDL